MQQRERVEEAKQRNRAAILKLREDVGGVLTDYQDNADTLAVTAEEAYQNLCADQASGRKAIPSIPIWDDLFGPLRPGNLYVVAGYPGVGKTSLALNMAWAIAQREKVWFCCLEMEPGEVLSMMAPIVTDASVREEGAMLAQAYATIQPTGMRFSRIPGSRDWKSLFKAIMRTAEIEQFKCLFIDNFMFMTRATKDVLAVEGLVSMGLKQEAQRLGIPIVLLHHLRKPSDDGLEPEPGAHAMRGSGALHADASVVAILHHPLTKGDDQIFSTRDEVGYLAAGKNRFGGGGKKYVRLDGERHTYSASSSINYNHPERKRGNRSLADR